jgi:tryptophan synthase alpha chain
MVTPVTEPARLAKLCAATQGFVYAVTMTGTTGRTAAVPSEVTAYLDTGAPRFQTTGVCRLRHSAAGRRWSSCVRTSRV